MALIPSQTAMSSWKTWAIILVWLIFIAFWTASAFVYKSSTPRKRDKRLILLLCACLPVAALSGFFLSVRLFKKITLPTHAGIASDVTGISMLVFGIFFAIWARITIGRFWSGAIELMENQPVILSGPYSIVRHPIYAGVIALLWGGFLLERNVFFLLTSITGTTALLLKARLEETFLTKHIGKEYLAYKKTTPALFPFFHKRQRLFH